MYIYVCMDKYICIHMCMYVRLRTHTKEGPEKQKTPRCLILKCVDVCYGS